MKRSLKFKSMLVACTAAGLSMLPVTSALAADVPQTDAEVCYPINQPVICMVICMVQQQSVKSCTPFDELIAGCDTYHRICDVEEAIFDLIP